MPGNRKAGSPEPEYKLVRHARFRTSDATLGVQHEPVSSQEVVLARLDALFNDIKARQEEDYVRRHSYIDSSTCLQHKKGSIGERRGSVGERYGNIGDRKASLGERRGSIGDRRTSVGTNGMGERRGSTSSIADRRRTSVNSAGDHRRSFNSLLDNHNRSGGFNGTGVGENRKHVNGTGVSERRKSASSTGVGDRGSSGTVSGARSSMNGGPEWRSSISDRRGSFSGPEPTSVMFRLHPRVSPHRDLGSPRASPHRDLGSPRASPHRDLGSPRASPHRDLGSPRASPVRETGSPRASPKRDLGPTSMPGRGSSSGINTSQDVEDNHFDPIEAVKSGYRRDSLDVEALLGSRRLSLYDSRILEEDESNPTTTIRITPPRLSPSPRASPRASPSRSTPPRTSPSRSTPPRTSPSTATSPRATFVRKNNGLALFSAPINCPLDDLFLELGIGNDVSRQNKVSTLYVGITEHLINAKTITTFLFSVLIANTHHRQMSLYYTDQPNLIT
ncbi:serine/arginine repetitive matrix protein 1-like [Procambarus clarkii]|uniref:serine/arginine repetitive matrix protein 1-like n=1 Tax=Procambarus clarkii TaxID=6728 RepID=UPI0037442EF1